MDVGMQKRSQKMDYHYCTPCGKTTKHNVNENGSKVCSQCNKEKAKKAFEDVLNNALGIVSEDVKAPKVELGKEKKSAEGAHRPDKGVKFHELSLNTEFKHKTNPDTLKP